MELELELAGKITATTFSKGGIDTQVPSVDRVPIIPTSSNRMYTSIKINDGKTEGQKPVSYTHLDVYKRQVEMCLAWLWSLSFWEWRTSPR